MDRKPTLRESRFAPDRYDGERIQYVLRHWDSQTASLLARDRTIEENIRMLLGQQWHVWNERFRRFLDVTEWMSEDERQWRHRPVFNRLMLWFIVTHARVTENPPLIGWLPGPDRLDAELADVMDVIFKAKWRAVGMTDVIDRLYQWLLPAGEAYLYSRVDPTKGPLRPWQGQANVPIEMQTEDGWGPLYDEMGNPMMQSVPDMPFTQDGSPASRLTLDGLIPIEGMEPFSDREGDITVDVLSPLQVRGQWGHHIAWHDKRWHARELFLLPEEVYDRWGVELEPDTAGTDAPGFTDRLLFGPGYFGSASLGATERTPSMSGRGAVKSDGYVRLLEFWERPCRYPGMEERQGYPGGRLTIVSRNTVLEDGPRPIAFPYLSPIRQFQFVRAPGRPSGTSLVEYMTSPQRSLNRLAGTVLESTALHGAPKKYVIRGSGLEHEVIDNRPDTTHVANPTPGGQPPLQYITPPSLNKDVWQASEMIKEYLTDVGSVIESPGRAPSADASGELVAQIRLDADRFLGPTQRRAAEELGRMAEDWKALCPVIYPTQRLITEAGEDSAVQTILVRPHIFEQGNVNAAPVIESMQPESRYEKQQRVQQLWQAGAFGDQLSPEARTMFLELSNFPHLSRAARPGGEDRSMAEKILSRILLGDPAGEYQAYEWYDFDVHLAVYERFMKRPEFRQQTPEVQGQLAELRQMFVNARLLKQQKLMAEQAFVEASVPMTPPSQPAPPVPMPAAPEEAPV